MLSGDGLSPDGLQRDFDAQTNGGVGRNTIHDGAMLQVELLDEAVAKSKDFPISDGHDVLLVLMTKQEAVVTRRGIAAHERSEDR